MTVPNETRKAAVYRLYDAEGTLLYIGSAYDPEGRCKAHRSKPWWPEVDRRVDEWHEDRSTAYRAEAQAIAAEAPTRNLLSTADHADADTLSVPRLAERAGVRRTYIHRLATNPAEGWPAPVFRTGSSRPEYDVTWFDEYWARRQAGIKQGKRTDLAIPRDEGATMPSATEQPTPRSARTAVSLTRTHWDSLRTQARLKAWVEARQMGLSVENCDRIADAAFDGVREMVEEWARQQAEEPSDG